MSLTPTHFWLNDVRYLEGKRAIVLEFSRLNLRRMSRQPFFPSFFISSSLTDLETLRKIVSPHKTRFRIEKREEAFKVSSANFSGLNLLANALFNKTGFRPIVLEPERQFLLEKGFSYFDCFTFFSENEFAKSNAFSVPEARTEFFSEPLHETIAQLLEENSQVAEKILESISASSLLRLPIGKIPSDEFRQLETLLENGLWETGIGITRGSESNPFSKKSNASFSSLQGLSEVDFSLLWPTLLTKPIFNLGPDTIDCECCEPKSVSDRNLLPNSLALVEFLQDGFFFESGFASFSWEFHRKNPEKESRLRRMKEFCLNRVPTGPFFRGQKALVPFSDAIILKRQKEAKTISVKEMHWFCLKKESFVSKTISSLNEVIDLLERSCDQAESTAVKEKGVLGTALLYKNLDFLLWKQRIKMASKLLMGVPTHLCTEKSAFFKPVLCSAVEAIEANTLGSFKDFAAEQESRVVSFSKGKAYIKSEKPYSLIKQFSKKQQIPSLIRAKSK